MPPVAEMPCVALRRLRAGWILPLLWAPLPARPAELPAAPTPSSPSGTPTATESAAAPRFDILEFVVEGDTLLGAAAIERAVYPFLGEQRSVADAEAARRALEKAYHDAGYLSVTVLLPPQRVDNPTAELRLQVVAAPVGRLRVEGASVSPASLIREALPSVAPGRVPEFNALQQELATLARLNSDREITPVLSAGSRPGTLDVELKVTERLPLNGHIEISNRQSLGTEAGRLDAALRYDNLWQRGHSIGLNWVGAPQRREQANVLSLQYHLPLGGPGDRLLAVWTHSDSATPTPLGGETVSRGDTWRLRWRDALRPLFGASQSLSWGLTLRDLRDGNRNLAGDETPATPLRYPSFSLGWDLDAPSATVPGRRTQLQAEFTLGLRALGRRSEICNPFGLQTAGRYDQFTCKRSTAESDFQTLGLSLAHTEPLGAFSLMARLSGQMAGGPLVPAEQFTAGGTDSVRGYREGEQAGDLGAVLRLELAAPAWQPAEGLRLQPALFLDAAWLHKLEALPGELAHPRLASVGLGLAVQHRAGLSLGLSWAQVLRATTQVVSSQLRQTATDRGGRFDAWLRQSF